MESRYKVVGVNDDKDFCECCGKKDLKRVVWIEDIETQEIKHFGTSCAAAPVKGFGVEKEIKQAIKKFKDQQQAMWAYAHRLYRKSGGTYTGNGQDGWKANDIVAFGDCMSKAKAALN